MNSIKILGFGESFFVFFLSVQDDSDESDHLIFLGSFKRIFPHARAQCTYAITNMHASENIAMVHI